MPWPMLRYLFGMLGTLLRYRLHHLIQPNQLTRRSARALLWLLRVFLPARADMPHQLAMALSSRGPVYIKLGQLLSTRPDILGLALCQGLAKLQDRVTPMPDHTALALIHQALGETADTAFQHIESTPMASASIAQVHGAQLVSGQEVVIKVVRPDIEEQIRSEMQSLIAVARWLETRLPFMRQLHITQIMTDQLTIMLTELSMFSEARNQIQLRRNFADSPLLHVPRLYPKFTRENLLVMDRIQAPSIGDMDYLREKGVDFKVLAHKGVETFFTQVFEHNFFHADMHPGNVFVDISNPQDPQWIALDCAIIGSLSEADQSYLAQNLIAFFARDYAQIVRLHLRSGWIPADTDADAFEQVIREVCEPIFAKPLNEISFTGFMTQLLDTAREFGMQVQPQLVLLQKTLLYVEGLGRQLYPQLDLWETAEPFMRHWAVRHLGAIAVISKLLDRGPKLIGELHRIPELLDDNQTIDLRKQLTQQQRSLDELQTLLGKLQRRGRQGWLFATMAGLATFIWFMGH